MTVETTVRVTTVRASSLASSRTQTTIAARVSARQTVRQIKISSSRTQTVVAATAMTVTAIVTTVAARRRVAAHLVALAVLRVVVVPSLRVVTRLGSTVHRASKLCYKPCKCRLHKCKSNAAQSGRLATYCNEQAGHERAWV